MANFIGMVFATLQKEGVDTKGMSTDEAVKKFNELKGKNGGGKDGGDKKAQSQDKKGLTPNESKRLKQLGIDDIDYDNVKYPRGTSKEYTEKVNKNYEKALPILSKLGITPDDFGGKKSKEGGFEDNTEEIMNKYVFKPFRQKYPKGNNAAWEKEYQPIYDAIEAVGDKHYNDFYIRNHQ